MSSFLDLGVFWFIITLRQKEFNADSVELQDRVTFGLLSQRIVNKKPLNLEKTTSSVLSVILINLRYTDGIAHKDFPKIEFLPEKYGETQRTGFHNFLLKLVI